MSFLTKKLGAFSISKQDKKDKKASREAEEKRWQHLNSYPDNPYAPDLYGSKKLPKSSWLFKMDEFECRAAGFLKLDPKVLPTAESVQSAVQNALKNNPSSETIQIIADCHQTLFSSTRLNLPKPPSFKRDRIPVPSIEDLKSKKTRQPESAAKRLARLPVNRDAEKVYGSALPESSWLHKMSDPVIRAAQFLALRTDVLPTMESVQSAVQKALRNASSPETISRITESRRMLFVSTKLNLPKPSGFKTKPFEEPRRSNRPPPKYDSPQPSESSEPSSSEEFGSPHGHSSPSTTESSSSITGYKTRTTQESESASKSFESSASTDSAPGTDGSEDSVHSEEPLHGARPYDPAQWTTRVSAKVKSAAAMLGLKTDVVPTASSVKKAWLARHAALETAGERNQLLIARNIVLDQLDRIHHEELKLRQAASKKPPQRLQSSSESSVSSTSESESSTASSSSEESSGVDWFAGMKPDVTDAADRLRIDRTRQPTQASIESAYKKSLAKTPPSVHRQVAADRENVYLALPDVPKPRDLKNIAYALERWPTDLPPASWLFGASKAVISSALVLGLDPESVPSTQQVEDAHQRHKALFDWPARADEARFELYASARLDLPLPHDLQSLRLVIKLWNQPRYELPTQSWLYGQDGEVARSAYVLGLSLSAPPTPESLQKAFQARMAQPHADPDKLQAARQLLSRTPSLDPASWLYLKPGAVLDAATLLNLDLQARPTYAEFREAYKSQMLVVGKQGTAIEATEAEKEAFRKLKDAERLLKEHIPNDTGAE